MKDQLQHKYIQNLILWGSMFGLVMLFIIGIAQSATAGYTLPPRATPEPNITAAVNVDPAAGGRVFLRVHFSEDWPWEKLHWQEGLWNVVQWRDQDGNWLMVDGWQGTLESIQQQEDEWVGQKELWTSGTNLGAGPFRWLVYQGKDGRLMSTSPDFYLPTESGGVVQVDMGLNP